MSEPSKSALKFAEDLMLEKMRQELRKATAEAEKAESELRTAKMIEAIARKHSSTVELPKIKLGSS